MNMVHLDWQPVILLKPLRLPFDRYAGLSVRRAYLALDAGQLLYADWTLEADERCAELVCPTGWRGWKPHASLTLPLRLEGKSVRMIPSGTWLLPYSDALFTLYNAANTGLSQLMQQVETLPTNPVTLTALTRLTHLL